MLQNIWLVHPLNCVSVISITHYASQPHVLMARSAIHHVVCLYLILSSSYLNPYLIIIIEKTNTLS